MRTATSWSGTFETPARNIGRTRRSGNRRLKALKVENANYPFLAKARRLLMSDHGSWSGPDRVTPSLPKMTQPRTIDGLDQSVVSAIQSA
jgi:hypothetical protein